MFNRKGQNIAEYSILIALVIAAAVAMQVYVKRGIQGRVADAVDHAPAANLGDAGTISFATKQYEPYYQDNLANIDSTRTLSEDTTANAKIDRTAVIENTTKAAGSYEKATWVSETAR
jgi:uncharacterized protein (UPF0333 family)